MSDCVGRVRVSCHCQWPRQCGLRRPLAQNHCASESDSSSGGGHWPGTVTVTVAGGRRARARRPGRGSVPPTIMMPGPVTWLSRSRCHAVTKWGSLASRPRHESEPRRHESRRVRHGHGHRDGIAESESPGPRGGAGQLWLRFAESRRPGGPDSRWRSDLTFPTPPPRRVHHRWSKMLYLSVGQVRPLRWKICLLSCAWFDNIN